MGGPLDQVKRLNGLDLGSFSAATSAALASAGSPPESTRPEPATRGFTHRIRRGGVAWDLSFHTGLGGLPLPRLVLVSHGASFPVSLDLTPERGLLVWIAKRLWLTDVEMGSPDFDRRFVVRTPAPDAARAFLNPSLKRALAELLARNGAAHLHVRVRQDGMMIEKHGIPEPADLPALLELIDLSCTPDPSPLP